MVKKKAKQTDKMRDLKAAIIGASSAFMLFLMVAPMIVLKTGPFNLPPPAAFLHAIGLNIYPLPWITHFLYGILWSVVYVHLLKDKVNTLNGIGFAMVLWLVMMLVFSPIMGWGFFGLGEAHLLPPNDPMYLAEGYGYALITFSLHLVYGIMIGSLNALWGQVKTL